MFQLFLKIFYNLYCIINLSKYKDNLTFLSKYVEYSLIIVEYYSIFLDIIQIRFVEYDGTYYQTSSYRFST